MQMLRKVIGVPLEKSMRSDGKLLVKGKFTSDNKDEVGDIITRSATERALPKYRQWGNIRRMHLPQPVGRVTRIGVEDGLEWNEVEFNVIDPQAQFEVENGLLQALSVGILMQWDDIDMLEDGGWVINDYSLAEISLVDHPANYDAALDLNLSMDAELRGQVREQGLYAVLRDLGSAVATRGEKPKMDKTDKQDGLAEEIADAVDQSAVQELVEEAAAPEEVPVDAEPVEAPAAEPESEAPAAELVVSIQPDLTAVLSAVEALTRRVDALTEKLPTPQPETEVKSEPAEDPSAGRIQILEEEIKALRARLDEQETPVNRKGALPVEEPPAETAPVAAPEKAERPKDLRSAVRKYVAERT